MGAINKRKENRVVKFFIGLYLAILFVLPLMRKSKSFFLRGAFRVSLGLLATVLMFWGMAEGLLMLPASLGGTAVVSVVHRTSEMIPRFNVVGWSEFLSVVGISRLSGHSHESERQAAEKVAAATRTTRGRFEAGPRTRFFEHQWT